MDFTKAEIEMMLHLAKEGQETALKGQEIFAPLVFNYFSLLKKAGFSEEQALEIVKAHGFVPPAPAQKGD